jgi:nucleotide-binding universal stress UspA family protein
MSAEGYQHVLVPLDGSKVSHAALDGALPIAHSIGARISLVTVIDGTVCHAFESIAHTEQVSVTKAVERYLEGVKHDLAADGFAVETKVRESSGFTAAERIIEVADEIGADLIAMSTHGRSGLEKVLFGSVASAVLRNSPVPVLVFPQG